MMRCSKNSSDKGFLGRYLDAICPRYTAEYHKLMENRGDSDIDALDVAALLLMEEMGVSEADMAASRAFLSVLIENEHLPLRGQLDEQELQALRDLLFCYFSGAQNINEKGSQVQALIEHKFTNGDFSQAKILLQIFETNQETRQNNERNLYYEEMIMRLDGVSPSHAKPLAPDIAYAALEEDACDGAVICAMEACAQNANIHFLLYLRDLEETQQWKNVTEAISSNVSDYLLSYIPVIHWRPLGALKENILSQIERHIDYEMIRRHIQQKLKMCYFILLASGITGYEWFIFAFTEWSRTKFDVDIREVFPVLHRSSIVDGMCLQEILDMTLERFYGPAIHKISVQSEIERAYRETIHYIFTSDLSQFPEGNYNFGDFILDRILEFPYEDPSFACRLHLLM